MGSYKTPKRGGGKKPLFILFSEEFSLIISEKGKWPFRWKCVWESVNCLRFSPTLLTNAKHNITRTDEWPNPKRMKGRLAVVGGESLKRKEYGQRVLREVLRRFEAPLDWMTTCAGELPRGLRPLHWRGRAVLERTWGDGEERLFKHLPLSRNGNVEQERRTLFFLKPL